MEILGYYIPLTAKKKPTKQKQQGEKMADYQGKTNSKENKEQSFEIPKKLKDKLSALTKCKKTDFDSTKQLLDNKKNEIKKEFEENPDSQEIQNIKDKIFSLKCDKEKALVTELQNQLNKIFGITQAETKKIVSEQPSVGNISPKLVELEKEIQDISTTLKRIEKENLDPQGKNISDIAHNTDDLLKNNSSFWDKFKNSIPKPNFQEVLKKLTTSKTDLENSIHSVNRKVEQSENALSQKIGNIKFPQMPNFPKIPKDYLRADDFKFELEQEFSKLSKMAESVSDLDVLPKKVENIEIEMKNIFEKLYSFPTESTPSKNVGSIPKEEKSVRDLAQFMSDGITQFETIAVEYISKIGELENLEKTKKKFKQDLEDAKSESFTDGKKAGEIEFIKHLAESFPSYVKDLKSDYLSTKFQADEVLEISNENKNEIFPFVNKGDIGKYQILTPATLLDNKILFKAQLELIVEKSATGIKKVKAKENEEDEIISIETSETPKETSK